MKVKDVTEDGEVCLGGLVEVDPEEGSACEQVLCPLGSEMHLADVVLVDDVAGRSLGRRGVGATCRYLGRPFVGHRDDGRSDGSGEVARSVESEARRLGVALPL